jgi:hypothetical protein
VARRGLAKLNLTTGAVDRTFDARLSGRRVLGLRTRCNLVVSMATVTESNGTSSKPKALRVPRYSL